LFTQLNSEGKKSTKRKKVSSSNLRRSY